MWSTEDVLGLLQRDLKIEGKIFYMWEIVLNYAKCCDLSENAFVSHVTLFLNSGELVFFFFLNLGYLRLG